MKIYDTRMIFSIRQRATISRSINTTRSIYISRVKFRIYFAVFRDIYGIENIFLRAYN